MCCFTFNQSTHEACLPGCLIPQWVSVVSSPTWQLLLFMHRISVKNKLHHVCDGTTFTSACPETNQCRLHFGDIWRGAELLISRPVTIQQGAPSDHSLLWPSLLISPSSLQIHHFSSQVSPSVPITSFTSPNNQPYFYSCLLFTQLFPHPFLCLTLSDTLISLYLECHPQHNISPNL